MVTRSLLKQEIDRVREEHLTALYNIIKVFALPAGTFDYAQWQKTLWEDQSIEEISRAAMRICEENAETPVSQDATKGYRNEAEIQ